MEQRVGARRATFPQCALGCPARKLTTLAALRAVLLLGAALLARAARRRARWAGRVRPLAHPGHAGLPARD
eukprot:3113113-Alexandrium_andersonii.AAC.1